VCLNYHAAWERTPVVLVIQLTQAGCEMSCRIGLSEDVAGEDQGGECEKHLGDSMRSCSVQAGLGKEAFMLLGTS
jgi:hypothetical protein